MIMQTSMQIFAIFGELREERHNKSFLFLFGKVGIGKEKERERDFGITRKTALLDDREILYHLCTSGGI